MVRVQEVYFINDDVRTFKRRLEWLDKRLAERGVNDSGSGYDRAERKTLARLVSQIEEKGKACDPPSKDAFDAKALRKAGWNIQYLGHSKPKPWTAAKQVPWFDLNSERAGLAIKSIEAATFNELEALAAAEDSQ